MRTGTYRVRKLLVWSLAVLTMLLLQYVTISNVDLSPVGSDTAPHRGPLNWAVSRVSFITLQPLLPIMAHASRTLGSRWTGDLCRAIFRFKTPTANFVSFAVVNSAIWLLAAAVMLRLARCIRQLGRGRPA